MSVPSQQGDWVARLRGIRDAQWMQAIAWRVVMRVLPVLPGLSPTWTHAAMRLLYATIFWLDRDYRRRLGSAASEATIRAALATEPLIETGGEATDYLLRTGGGEYLYPTGGA